MPTCYLVAVATDASLDKDTNNWSLFHLVNTIATDAIANRHEAGFAIVRAALELHVYWEFADLEYDVPYQFRVLFQREADTAGPEHSIVSKSLDLSSSSHTMRTRLRGPMLLPEGQCHVRVEWTPHGTEEWNAVPIAWPIEVTAVEGTGGDGDPNVESAKE